MTPFRMATISLIRHPFATVISVIAFGISVACAGVLLRLYQVSDSRFTAMGNGGDAIVGAKAGGIEILLNSLNGEGNFPDFIPYKLYKSLRSYESVGHTDGTVTQPFYLEDIIPFVYFARYGDYRIAGTESNFYERKNKEDSLKIAHGAWSIRPGEAVIGSLVAAKSGLKVGSTLNATAWFDDDPDPGSEVPLSVAGILEPTGSQWDRTIFSSVEQAHAVFNLHRAELKKKSIWDSEVLHYFLVYLKPDGFKPLAELINKRTVAQAIDINSETEKLHKIFSAGRSVGFFVTTLVILLGGLSIASMLITRFEGMTLQIAVLRALGYSTKELAGWLLYEGLLLGALGVLLGGVIDALLFPALRYLLGTALPPPELVSSSVFDSSSIWLIAIVVTILAVLIPVFKVSTQNTHDALRGL